jgi:hypothetical protein
MEGYTPAVNLGLYCHQALLDRFALPLQDETSEAAVCCSHRGSI